MTDIATLGLAVDSTGVKSATAALGQFAAAAKPAAAAADDLSHKHAGLDSASQAAFHSTRSLVEALAAGQPITTALAQQISHLSFIAASPSGLTGSFANVARTMLGMVSASALVVGGLAAITVGGVLALHSIAQTEKAFDDVASSAGVTVGALHSLAAAAAFKGISADEFTKASEKLASNLYDAQHNMGSLGTFLRANGQTATDFQGTLGKVADLIKNAGRNQEKLQLLTQAGLPATQDWVRFLGQGADGIRAATAEATKFGGAADESMIAKAREFDEAWAKTITNFTNGFKSGFVSFVHSMSTVSDMVNSIYLKLGANPTGLLKSAITAGAGSKLGNNSSADDFYSKLGTGAPGNTSKPTATVDPNVLAHQIALQQQALGLLGQTANATDAVRQVELSVQAARLNGVSIDQKKVEVLKQLAYETSLGVTQTKAQTDSENVNAAVVGMSVGQTAEYTAVQNALNEAKRNGRTLTLADTAAIKASASALGQATQNADNMRFAFTGLVQGPMETFVQQISQGATAMDALKAAGVSALNAISKKLADMAADSLWQNALGSGASSVFNLLGLGGASGVNAAGGIIGASGPTSVGGAPLVAAGLHGGGGPGDAPTFTRTLPASMFSHAPRYHGGIGPGEKAAVIRNDESVLTPGQMRQLSPNSGGTNVQVGVSVDDDGNLQAYVKSISQQASADATSAFAGSPQFVDHVAKASRKARTQRKI